MVFRTLRLYPWWKYPKRTCRTMHDCCICKNTISYGEQYYDGGYSRRAHVICPSAKSKEK